MRNDHDHALKKGVYVGRLDGGKPCRPKSGIDSHDEGVTMKMWRQKMHAAVRERMRQVLERPVGTSSDSVGRPNPIAETATRPGS